jgi:hypothetical protein
MSVQPRLFWCSGARSKATPPIDGPVCPRPPGGRWQLQLPLLLTAAGGSNYGPPAACQTHGCRARRRPDCRSYERVVTQYGHTETASSRAQERRQGAERGPSQADDLEAVESDSIRARTRGSQGSGSKAWRFEGHRERRRSDDGHGTPPRGGEAGYRGPLEDGQGATDPCCGSETPLRLVLTSGCRSGHRGRSRLGPINACPFTAAGLAPRRLLVSRRFSGRIRLPWL